jgi:hypothetical protein
MAKPKIKRFGNPEFLRKIKPETLLKLLRCFNDFFRERGMDFSGSSLNDAQLEQLSALIVSPPSTCPGAFLDAVDMLDTLSSNAGLDELRMVDGELVRKVQEKGDSAGDIAVKVWLMDRTALERIYTKFSIDRGRTMKCFSPGKGHRPVTPDRAICRAMEKDLEFACADLFDSPTCEVLAFDDEDGHAFLIRHGEHVKRFEILDDENKRDTRALRLLKHDVAFVYHTGEVLLSGRSEGIRETYRSVFSEHIFGEKRILVPSKRFTLEPIRRGRDCLNPTELDDSAAPMLRELQIQRRGAPRSIVIRGDNVFDELEEHGSDFLRSFHLVRARFTLGVEGERKSPSVVICPDHDVIRGDIHHPVVRQWLDDCPFNLLSHAPALANH